MTEIIIQDGDYVTFCEVKGTTELNECEPVKITAPSESGYCSLDWTVRLLY